MNLKQILTGINKKINTELLNYDIHVNGSDDIKVHFDHEKKYIAFLNKCKYRELYLSLDDLTVNFMYNNKSYRLFIDTDSGYIKLDHIFENKDDKQFFNIKISK